MTLNKWLEAHPDVGVYCPKLSPYFKWRWSIPITNNEVAMVYSHDPELWHLDDYRVSSHAGGGLVVLVPVPVDKPKQKRPTLLWRGYRVS